MAYAETCTGALEALTDLRSVAFAYADDAESHTIDAGVHWVFDEDHLAIQDLIYACEDLADAVLNHAGLVQPFYPLSPLEWYLSPANNCAGVTWQKICLAWAKSDFEGRAMTIGFIDRMRQLLWDEPFYIAFAARPESQE